MAGGIVIQGTADASRIEAPVTAKAYFMCAFAAFGGIFYGYDTGWMSGTCILHAASFEPSARCRETSVNENIYANSTHS